MERRRAAGGNPIGLGWPENYCYSKMKSPQLNLNDFIATKLRQRYNKINVHKADGPRNEGAGKYIHTHSHILILKSLQVKWIAIKLRWIGAARVKLKSN